MKNRILIIILIVAVILLASYFTGLLGKLIPAQQQLYFTVDFAATPTNQTFTVQFNATVSGGIAPYKLVWDFGDGNLSTQPSPKHVYAKAGTFTVVLLIIDSANVSRSVTKPVVVA